MKKQLLFDIAVLKFLDTSREASVTEIIFRTSCKFLKFSGQLFDRTPLNGCFCFNDFSMKHAELGKSLAVITEWF